VNHQNIHHVIKSVDQLKHDFLNGLWTYLPLFDLHYFFEVVSVAELHEDVVPGVSFDGFLQADHIVAKN